MTIFAVEQKGGKMKDPIERQAAIEVLADYIHNVDKVYSTGKLSADDCRDAAKSVLDELPPAQSEQHWIPCSERLPEDNTEVFVYLFDRPSPYSAWVCDGCWFTEEFQVEKENYPKAWMLLPKPYRKDSEEDG